VIQSTRLAKAAYWLAGELSRVKTYQQTYSWKNPEAMFTAEPGESLPEIEMVKAGRLWLPCALSMKLLVLSEKLDVEHRDHWALEHSLCEEGLPCRDCGGHIDPPHEEEGE
jgi:hypothetical protein